MKLVPASLIITDISADNLSSLTDVIEGALDKATSELEAVIRTTFDLETREDLFFIRSGGVLRTGDYFRYKLALTKGFLSGVPTITYGENLDATDTELAAAANWTIDLVKGELSIHTLVDIRNMFVRVAYTAGFDVDGDDAELFDQDAVPQWLKNGARAYGLANLYAYRPEISGEDNKIDPKQIRANANFGLTRHTRYFPSAVRPMA